MIECTGNRVVNEERQLTAIVKWITNQKLNVISFFLLHKQMFSFAKYEVDYS